MSGSYWGASPRRYFASRSGRLQKNSTLFFPAVLTHGRTFLHKRKKYQKVLDFVMFRWLFWNCKRRNAEFADEALSLVLELDVPGAFGVG